MAAWQCLAATQTVDADLSRATLKHFTACVVCFYLGLFCLNRNQGGGVFLWPIASAFVAMLVVGFGQHFGGLEETRRLLLHSTSSDDENCAAGLS